MNQQGQPNDSGFTCPECIINIHVIRRQTHLEKNVFEIVPTDKHIAKNGEKSPLNSGPSCYAAYDAISVNCNCFLNIENKHKAILAA